MGLPTTAAPQKAKRRAQRRAKQAEPPLFYENQSDTFFHITGYIFSGRRILPDQAMDVVLINIDGPALPSNFAYIHVLCKSNELAVCEVLGDVSAYTHRELLDRAQEITTALGPQARVQLPGPLRENWPFMPLKRWFAKKNSASITLTFKEIEAILGRKLSPSARQYTSRWYTRPDRNAMAEAWVTEGYELFKLGLEKEILLLTKFGVQISEVFGL